MSKSGEQRSYTPFDPEKELRKVRALSSKKGEQRVAKKEAIEKFKGNLLEQQYGVGAITSQLSKKIHENPAIPTQDLIRYVDKYASKFRLTEQHIATFRLSLEQFEAKRKNIDRLYDRYEDAPATLFKDCFGREPQGEVDCIKTPFMLLIRCHDPKDFEIAITYRGADNNDSDTYHYTPEDAENAAGFAYTELLEPILDEAYKGVAVEKVPKEDQEQDVLKHTTIELLTPHAQSLLPLKELGTLTLSQEKNQIGSIVFLHTNPLDTTMAGRDLIVMDKDDLVLQAVSVYVDSQGTVYKDLGFLATKEGAEKARRLYFDANFLKLQWLVQGMSGRHKEKLRKRVTITIPTESQTGAGIRLTLEDPFLVITNNSDANTMIMKSEIETTMTTAAKQDTQVRDHEEQHQINELFRPLETMVSLSQIASRAKIDGEGKANLETEHEILKNFVRAQRRLMGIDQQARDEILAYYRDGRNLPTIETILCDSALYNIRKLFAKKIDRIPQTFIEVLEAERASSSAHPLLRTLFQSGQYEYRIGHYIDQVFEKEYKRDIKKWISAIQTMQSASYFPQEILALFYPLPPQSWATYARRMEKLKLHAENEKA